jgi:hypothetical protein
VGGVVGGVVLLVLLALFLFLWRRRNAKRRTLLQPMAQTGVFPPGMFPLSWEVVHFQSLLT